MPGSARSVSALNHCYTAFRWYRSGPRAGARRAHEQLAAGEVGNGVLLPIGRGGHGGRIQENESPENPGGSHILEEVVLWLTL